MKKQRASEKGKNKANLIEPCKLQLISQSHDPLNSRLEHT